MVHLVTGYTLDLLGTVCSSKYFIVKIEGVGAYIKC